jgi:hypothetical protein
LLASKSRGAVQIYGACFRRWVSGWKRMAVDTPNLSAPRHNWQCRYGLPYRSGNPRRGDRHRPSSLVHAGVYDLQCTIHAIGTAHA